MARLVLLHTSPRVPPGLLTRDAWTALAGAAAVLARNRHDPTPVAVAESGIAVEHLGPVAPAQLARLLLDRAEDPAGRYGEATGVGGADDARHVVWIGSDDGDPGLSGVLAAESNRSTRLADVQVLVGSHDVRGSRILDLVGVMDRLRSPGGCPWDAEQTHASLARYLLEEAHEALEAIESGDRPHMVEELGDVLLQVVFHARIGQEDTGDPFDIDDVAAGIVAKLVRRHPHVFADGSAETAADVEIGWEQIKAAEKPDRASVLDGIPADLPALARAAKVLSRLDGAGRKPIVDAAIALHPDSLGSRLLALVREAGGRGEDPEAALRGALRALQAAAR